MMAIHTAFHLACLYDDTSEIAKMIMENSSQLEIGLNMKNNDGNTAFHGAEPARMVST
jgi:ankyrin repeat protein